jgi:hypothetical protein
MVLGLVLLTLGGAWLIADAAPSTQPVSLERLSQETRDAYQKVRGGIVCLQLPTPRWLMQLAEQQNPLHKWNSRLHPDVRRRLEEEQAHPNQHPHFATVIMPSTIPATTQPVGRTWRVVLPDGGQVVVVESADHGDSPRAAEGRFAANNIGLLLDGEGHILVPLYIEKEAFAEHSAPAMLGDGTLTAAHFVSSDRPTNLTLMQLDRPAGHAVRLSMQKPEEGSLVLMLAPEGIPARLTVWTGGIRDYGVVVALDGNVAGFSRFGQFMDGATCRPVVDQMIQYGRVNRAVLGVLVSTVRPDDPARRWNDALGIRPAIRIEQVNDGSVADAAGLRKGDYILSLGDQTISDTPTFAAVMAAREGKTDFQILRGDETIKITIDLKPR